MSVQRTPLHCWIDSPAEFSGNHGTDHTLAVHGKSDVGTDLRMLAHPLSKYAETMRAAGEAVQTL